MRTFESFAYSQIVERSFSSEKKKRKRLNTETYHENSDRKVCGNYGCAGSKS